VSGLIFGKQGLAAIQKRREEGVDTEHEEGVELNRFAVALAV
jgi:hypothetical protein